MKFNKIKNYIDMLLFLYSHKNTELNNVVKEFGMNYQTVNSIFKNWIEAGYIAKKMKDRLLLGGDKYEYQLSEKGVEFLKNLTTTLLKTLGLTRNDAKNLATTSDSRTTQELKEKIVGFCYGLPEILNDLDVDLDQGQLKILGKKIENFFKEYDISFIQD